MTVYMGLRYTRENDRDGRFAVLLTAADETAIPGTTAGLVMAAAPDTSAVDTAITYYFE
jgi:hypothetical protein